MAFLINRYFQELPQEIKERPETNIVYHILSQGKGFDYNEFVAGISSIEKGHTLPQKIEANVLSNSICDFRIRKYMIAHFRKFDDKNGLPYTLNFINENNEVCSLFLVGKNGSGKTSLYNGLEYIFTNTHISTIEQRAISNKEQFLPYGKRNMDEIDIGVEINSQENGIYKVLSSPLYTELNFKPFFCSEFDLLEIHRNNNLKLIFATNLGLSGIGNILSQIKESIENFKSKGNLSLTFVDTIPNADALQSDIFLLMSEKEKRKSEYRTRLERLNSISIATKKFQNIKAKDSVLDRMEEIQLNIEYIVNNVLKYTSELSSFKFFIEKQPVIEKYKRVLRLMNDSKIEAYELYITLPPIEEFGMELYNYASYISQRFFDWKNGESKSVSKQEALKYIEELMKSETESERQRILNEDRASSIISPYYIERLEDLYNALIIIYQKDEEYMLKTCKEIIVPLLNEFTKLGDISAENEKIDIITIDNEIHAVISNDKIFGKGVTTTPELFYNSFRYKLYCISVKVSLAFLTMKFSGINAPLFFDDVFNASDFDNSINIDNFFNIVISSYEKLGIGKKKDLQIVLFTHDEVVLNSISQAMRENVFNIDIKYICGILQEAESLDDNDLQNISNGKAYLLYDKIN